MRNAVEEVASPKYAHIERERRWLVDRTSRPAVSEQSHILIEDRYIDNSRMRLRKMTDGATGDVVCKLTKKYECPNPLARPIVTAYLTDEEYIIFAELPALLLTKLRYAVEDGGITWSLDCFENELEGLELLEIEWPDERAYMTCLHPLGC